MIKRLLVSILAATCLLGASCLGPRRMNQMQVGVWAAERELWEEAIFRWKRVLEANPKSAAAHNNLAVAYEKKGMFPEAQREYEEALKLAPRHVQIKANFDRFKLSRDTKPTKPPREKRAEETKSHEKP